MTRPSMMVVITFVLPISFALMVKISSDKINADGTVTEISFEATGVELTKN